MSERAVQFALMDMGLALLFILISMPLVLRKIPMNHLYGVRIQKALASSEDGYDINAYGGKALIKWSTILIVSGVVKLLLSGAVAVGIGEC